MSFALDDLRSDLVDLRRELHTNPEVGLDLPWTQQRILHALDGLPLEISTGTALSSITAVLRGGRRRDEDAPVVLLRADMDGLPVTEDTGLDYAATTGTMHACGHDLHMAMLVGAARALCADKDELPGDVVFMFQPGEEGHDGAGLMLEEGVLEAAGRRADAAYALHVWSALEPNGTFCTKPGTIMSASDRLTVTVIGRGGHGSAPHTAKDPVPPLCEMALGLQVMLARHFDVFDPAVITVGSIHAGSACNVIPESGMLDATVRSFSTATQDKLFELIPQVITGIADQHGVRAEIDLRRQYPATVNDEQEDAFVAQTVAEVFGQDSQARWSSPLTASEDFSRVLQAVPGAFIGLSAVPADADHITSPFNHSAMAIFDDDVLVDGARLFVELTTRRLAALADQNTD
ncbi:M20 metallopeptidase family protein [Gephyromycinifex aptenodytis]|uniref:M20 metallopeptidase family protein n=1 Tax=Gephyromycinifex aptenodytis TaxID=2716227 RepID=UPI001445254D|nr:M20 family metallopeptidase [Gephyromycinifex aptenodytis]